MERAARIRDYEIRLRASFTAGARVMTSRVFRKYVAELCEPDPAFDELYLEGCFATGTDVCPLRRRDRCARFAWDTSGPLAKGVRATSPSSPGSARSSASRRTGR